MRISCFSLYDEEKMGHMKKKQTNHEKNKGGSYTCSQGNIQPFPHHLKETSNLLLKDLLGNVCGTEFNFIFYEKF